MNIEIVEDKQSWDDFFTNSSIETSFFQSFNWGRFQEKIGNQILRIRFTDKERIVGQALGVIINAKRGKYLYVRNGPAMFWDNYEQASEILSLLKNLAREKGLWFIRISPLLELDSPKARILESFDFSVSHMHDVDALDTWILSLEQTEEEILQGMRKSTRYEIRKAERNGVEIIKTRDSAYIDAFYEIYKNTIERQNWTGYSKIFLKKQFEIFSEDGSALLYLSKYKEKFISGSIFIYYGDSSYYHYSGSLTEFKKIPSTSLIHWENIKEAKSRGLKKYNFWGISPDDKPNHPWYGLTFFKKGFGGYEKRWMKTRDIEISPLYKLTRIIERIDKWKKGY